MGDEIEFVPRGAEGRGEGKGHGFFSGLHFICSLTIHRASWLPLLARAISSVYTSHGSNLGGLGFDCGLPLKLEQGSYLVRRHMVLWDT